MVKSDSETLETCIAESSPERRGYPDTYNKQPLCIDALASQKNHMSLHLMGVYSDPEAEQ